MKKIIEIKKSGEHEIFLEKSGEYLVRLLAKQAHVQITGRWPVASHQKLNINLAVTHCVGENSARVLLKAVGQQYCEIKIASKIVIEPNCDQVESFFEGRVLLLESPVAVQIQPELEINNNDVKCGHATSISRIDAQQLFYLTSRGLTQKKATSMLSKAFLR